MENQTVFSPGSILINTETNKLYGVLVSVLPNNKIIVFRLDKNTHPIFSKLQLHPLIAKVGIINEHQYSNLKSALLKHYRTYNLTLSEKTMLQPLMNFAFPLGIPAYQPEVELPERDVAMMDLNSKLVQGNRIFIHTPPKSCYNHLDGKIVTILERTPTGIWTNLPSSESDITKLNNSMYHLFFKNSEIPTFGGVSRIVPITDETTTDSTPKLNEVLLEAFTNMRDQDQLTTTMQFNGDKVRVLPKNMKIIFPDVYAGMMYSPNEDNFIADPDIITSELAKKLGDHLIMGGKDNHGNVMEINAADNELVFNKEKLMNVNSSVTEQPIISLTDEGELSYHGGGKSKSQDATLEIDDIDRDLESYARIGTINSMEVDNTKHNIDDITDYIDPENPDDYSRVLNSLIDDDMDIMPGGISMSSRLTEVSKSRSGLMGDGNDDTDDHESIVSGTIDTEDQSEYEDGDVVEIIGESDVEVLDTFEKVKVVEVDELEKVYKESIQRDDLFNYKISMKPKLMQNDDAIKNQIRKEINIISLLKNKIAEDDRTIHFQPADYKPLVSKYMKGDFTNKFLIPLVINKKKIYLDKNKINQKDDYDKQTHEIIEDYYNSILNTVNLQDKKNTAVNNDIYTNNILADINPTVVDETDNIGLLFRLGEHIPNKHGSKDIARIFQDTLTIKYCDKPMKCQSYALTTMDFDYQVNLGPMGRYLDPSDIETGEVNLDEEAEQHDRDILYIQPEYKIYYQGDVIRMIGYLRPPLQYFNQESTDSLKTEKKYGFQNTLNYMYKHEKKDAEVVTINLEDINSEVLFNDADDETSKYDITTHPDKFVLFLLPQSEAVMWNSLTTELEKIIPSLDDILSIYSNNHTDKTIDNIYDILHRFNYDTTELNIDQYNKIIDKNNELVTIYESINGKLNKRFQEYQKVKQAKELAESKAGKAFLSNKGEGMDSDVKVDDNLDDDKFKLIPNVVLEEISKFYYKKYDNADISVDADDIRLRWFMTQSDNGSYLFKTLFFNFLKKFESEMKLESLETELAILKDKMNLAIADHQASTTAANNNVMCENKTLEPKVIKYPSLARLEEDNGKVSVDTDGEVISVGDYALVETETGKQLYKRDMIGTVDMWIKEDMAMLYKLLQDKKAKCDDNPEMKLEDANKCLFDMENIKCEVNDLYDFTKQKVEMENQIKDIQKQIDYIKRLPVLISEVNREIIKDRDTLLHKLHAIKNYWNNREEEEKELEEKLQSTIKRTKPCKHTAVIDYFEKLGTFSDERYYLAQAIFRTFLNMEPEFDHDFTKFDEDKSANNWCYCNICNQELLCNHIRLATHQIETEGTINFQMLKDIYSVESEGAFYCKNCDGYIVNSEVQDIDDFEKGEDGHMVQTRELTETTVFAEKQRQFVIDTMDKIIESAGSKEIEDLQLKVSIYKLMKQLCGVSMMTPVDEIEMLNFLKSFQFTGKKDLMKLLLARLGVNNLQVVKKQVDKFYIIYLACDIAARLLITLQTSRTLYNVHNKKCVPRIMGYPLIDDQTLLDGVNFMMCIIGQMAVLPEYEALADVKTTMLMGQIRKQVEDDNFIKNKIFAKLNSESEEIDHMYEFEGYYTNAWKTFLPRLEDSVLTWQPEKILNDANLKEVNYKNWNKMIDVGRENAINYALQIIHSVNMIVNNEDRYPRTGVASYCCLDENFDGKKYENINYFKKIDSKISTNLKNITETDIILRKLYDIKRFSVSNILYEPLFKPSQKVIEFSLNVEESEIKQLYLTFIDKGLNKGKSHIFDKFDRCVLSNELKRDLQTKTYNQQDYKRIEDAVVSNNQINIDNYVSMVEELETKDTNMLEKKVISDIVAKLPKLDILNYLKDFFNKIMESLDDILGPVKSNIKGKDKEIFNIHRHLSALNAQIDNEVESLVPKLSSTDKQKDKYMKVLSNMGYYKKLYEEYKESHSDSESDLFRYGKKEEYLQFCMKYMNDVMNYLKNNKLANPYNKEKIRPQYRDFLQFGHNGKLFKVIDKVNREIFDFSKCVKSKHFYKVLFPEMVSSINHYLVVISLVNMFEMIDNSKVSGKGLSGKSGEIVDYKFKQMVEKDPALDDFSQDTGINIQTDDITLDEDGNPIDMIESFEIKNSSNIKIIASFVITYLDYIADNQETYDDLTPSEINRIVTKDEQKRIERTLRTHEFLATEGNEEIKRLVGMQMKLARIDYKNFANFVQSEFVDEMAIQENDEYMGEKDEVEGDEDMPGKQDDDYYPGAIVVGADEVDEMDMNYDYIAVDDA